MIWLITLILLAIVNGLMIIGFYEATQYKEENVITETGWGKKVTEKMALWFIPYYGNKIIPKFWTKPLYSCTVCMSSIHSSYVYWGFMYCANHINTIAIAVYACYILLLAGVVTAMNKIF